MNSDDGRETREQKKSPWPLIVSGALIAGLVLAYFLVEPVHGFLGEAYGVLTSDDEQRISDWVDQLGIWGPLFIVGAMVVQIFLIVVPSPLLMIISVLAYGPVLGAAIAVVAILVAAAAGFGIGRLLGRVAVLKLVGTKRAGKLRHYSDRYGLWVVFVARLSPVLSNDGISLVGGLLGLNFFQFMAATAAGIVPLAVVFAYLGESNERLVTGSIVVTGVSFSCLLAYIIYDRRTDKTDRTDKGRKVGQVERDPELL